jgi:hypothetical protein
MRARLFQCVAIYDLGSSVVGVDVVDYAVSLDNCFMRRLAYTDCKDAQREHNSSDFQGNIVCSLIGDIPQIPRPKYVCPRRAWSVGWLK